MNKAFWQNKRVLITGHTGFKGSWLSLWLTKHGANICGYSLEPDPNPGSLFNAVNLKEKISSSHFGNINNAEEFNKIAFEFQPEIIFHMAAQALVSAGYNDPIETFRTNVMGTLNIFETARKLPSLKALINITSDKCYENTESLKGYTETAALGGSDPYSASKACAEIITSAYRNSFFAKSGIPTASVRAGNVIGGGDFTETRIIPDLVNAISGDKILRLRSPNSVRPWQHVLEPLQGYILLAEKLFDNSSQFAEAWNFGPQTEDKTIVAKLVDKFEEKIGRVCKKEFSSEQYHETKTLQIDPTKALSRLGWKTVFTTNEAVEWTAEWYKVWLDAPEDIYKFTLEQTDKYENLIEKATGASKLPDNNLKDKALREEVYKTVLKYYQEVHKPKNDATFSPGDRITYAGRVFDQNEMLSLTDATLDFWLTSGRFTDQFERDFAKILGVRFAALVNSGSSANLLAFSTLTSPLLKERQLKPGDEVITVACGFPTTVGPILQNQCVPVMLDVTLDDGTYNIDVSRLEEALSEKTKAVMIAHTLGNPFNLKAVTEFCQRNNLWLIEDNCDALGSLYDGKLTGTFGDLATSSFYPPHHLTMGEGGAVYSKNLKLKRIVESMRDWGRDCWCAAGKDNTCGIRFSQKLGQLPEGYDHKYTYSHFGYNLKATDLQASIGCVQLTKLEKFAAARRNNWQTLYDGIKCFEDRLILPASTPNSNPSWFGFLVTPRIGSRINKNQFTNFLEDRNIQTRTLFAGNIIRHPLFDQIRDNRAAYRTIGNLENSDYILNNTFWVGVYPGLTSNMLEYVIKSFHDFMKL